MDRGQPRSEAATLKLKCRRVMEGGIEDPTHVHATFKVRLAAVIIEANLVMVLQRCEGFSTTELKFPPTHQLS